MNDDDLITVTFTRKQADALTGTEITLRAFDPSFEPSKALSNAYTVLDDALDEL